MIAVVWDLQGEIQDCLRRKFVGLTQWERLRRTLRKAGAERIVLATRVTGDLVLGEGVEIRPAGEWAEVVRGLPEGTVLSFPLCGLVPAAGLQAMRREFELNPDRPIYWDAPETFRSPGESPLFVRTGDFVSVSPTAWKPTAPAWQRMVKNDEDATEASRQIHRTVFKAHEDALGLFQRKFSVPISKVLVWTPITPNAITWISLGVSLLAGIGLAQGTYSWMLAGALLSWFSSVLDGCDGEVARFKLQDSAFGCWLETVTDYLYYVIVFAGLTVGLARGRGDLYGWIGGGLLAGVVLTCVLFLHLRHVMSRDGRPSEFKMRLFSLIESSPRWLKLFMERSYVLMLRPTVCYLVLAVCVFNIQPFFLCFYAVGAQLSWILAIYLHRLAYQAR